MPSCALKREDSPSGRLALQPDAENVASRVDIAIMRRSAVAAFPAPYSKRAHTFRTAGGNGPAARARLGTVSLVGLDKHSPVPSGLVAEHMAECGPACIEHGLSHPRLYQPGSIHIADDDQTILPRQTCAGDVKLVTARVGDLGMDRADAALVSGALGYGKRGFVLLVMPERRNRSSVAAHGEGLEAKVDTDFTVPGGQIICDLALERDIPAPTCVLHESASPELSAYLAGLPEAEAPLEVDRCVTVDLHGAGNERDPTEGALRAEADAETRATPMLVTGPGKLATDGVDSVRMQAKVCCNSGGQPIQVDCGWPADIQPALPAALGLSLRCYAEVPNLIAGDSVSVEMLPCGRVFHTEFER